MKFRATTIPPERRWKIFLTGFLIFNLGYFGVQSLQLMRPMIVLPSSIDRLIPFIPWTIWIYISQIPLILSTAWLIKTPQLITKTYYRLAVASLISFLIFILIPTRIPREMHIEGYLNRLLFSLLYASDADSNCFPSLHVSLAILAFNGIRQSIQRNVAFYWGWSTLILISTLTTKQHYCIDVVGGIAIVVASHWFVDLFWEFAPLPESGDNTTKVE